MWKTSIYSKADMGTQQDAKLQFHQWNTLLLDCDITVEGLPQTLNTFFRTNIIEQKKV